MSVQFRRLCCEGLEQQVVGGRFGALVVGVKAERERAVEDVGQGNECRGGAGKVEEEERRDGLEQMLAIGHFISVCPKSKTKMNSRCSQ